MFKEAFHHALKIVYFEHKQNNHLGILINTLLKLVRDKAFISPNKDEKEKWTHNDTLCDINEFHTATKELLIKASITTTDGSKRRVPWQTMSSMYKVQRMQDTCSCKLSCGICKTYVHMHFCTCLDAPLHITVCTYVHFIHIRYPPANTTNSAQPQHSSYFTQVINSQWTVASQSGK